MEATPEAIQEAEKVIAKNPKASRYYYRHREKVLEQRRQKKLQDPEYVAKMNAREAAKEAREAAKKLKEEAAKKLREEAKEEKRAKMAKLLGVDSPGIIA
jgi:hypothetical protein